jgi:hypothetical protein
LIEFQNDKKRKLRIVKQKRSKEPNSLPASKRESIFNSTARRSSYLNF